MSSRRANNLSRSLALCTQQSGMCASASVNTRCLGNLQKKHNIAKPSFRTVATPHLLHTWYSLNCFACGALINTSLHCGHWRVVLPSNPFSTVFAGCDLTKRFVDIFPRRSSMHVVQPFLIVSCLPHDITIPPDGRMRPRGTVLIADRRFSRLPCSLLWRVLYKYNHSNKIYNPMM